MNAAKIIKEILKRSEDTHNIFTPFELCKEMLDKIPELNKDQVIMVMFNLEFLYLLREKFGKENMNNVWFLTPCKLKEEAAKNIGVDQNQIVIYSYNKKEIEEKEMPKFDVCVTNPPYQSSTKIKNRANALWPSFVELAFNICKENAIIGMFIPSTWMNSNLDENKSGRITTSQLRSKIFKNKSIKYINIKSDISKSFNVGVNICYFISTNKQEENKTLLETNEGCLYIIHNDMEFIPNKINDCIYSILNKTIFNKNLSKIKLTSNDDVRFTSDTRHFEHLSFNKTNKHIYPACNTSAQYSKGNFIWADVPHKLQFTPKLIFSDSGYAKPFYDKGEFGLCFHSHSILVNNEQEANCLINYFECKFVKFIENLLFTSGFATGLTKIIKYLPEIEYHNDEELYKYFKLSEEEIKYIKS